MFFSLKLSYLGQKVGSPRPVGEAGHRKFDCLYIGPQDPCSRGREVPRDLPELAQDPRACTEAEGEKAGGESSDWFPLEGES